MFVSTHAPAWGATNYVWRKNPPHDVSTHAPAWGATRLNLVIILETSSVSPHAPAWGATQKLRWIRLYHLFQPTLPHGERRLFRKYISNGTSFNPRSRMGSDEKKIQEQLHGQGFNPRSRMGSDTIHFFKHFLIREFQPTLPHGERRHSSHLPQGTVSFNPRSRMGSDPQDRRHGNVGHVSTHAPAWGATVAFNISDF